MYVWAVIAVVGIWVIAAGCFVAAGMALRAALRRRLALGSRLFVWREPARIIEGREAVRTSIAFLVFCLGSALFFLALAIKVTPVLSRIPVAAT